MIGVAEEPHNVREAVASLEELAGKRDPVRIGDVLDTFGERSFGPLLMILALLEITPVGSIPGVPTVIATLCVLLAGQLALGHDPVWLPQWVQRRSLRADKLATGAQKLEGVAERLDRLFKGRLERFATDWWQRAAGLAVILLCLTVPPLELLPLASTVPMLAIASIGLALTVRDGLLLLIAITFAGLAMGAGVVFAIAQLGGGGAGG